MIANALALTQADFDDDDDDDDDMYDADLDDDGAGGGGGKGQTGGGWGGVGVGPIAMCTRLMQAVAGWCPKETVAATMGLMNPRVSNEVRPSPLHLICREIYLDVHRFGTDDDAGVTFWAGCVAQSKRQLLGILFDSIQATSAQHAATALDTLRQLCDDLDMDAPTRLWALKQLETLCTSLGAAAKERFAPLAAQWEAIMGVAMRLTAQMEGEEEAAFLSILLSDDGRVQLCDTLAAHMRVAPKRFQEECVLWEGELQRGFAEVFMTDLLNDPNYRVRARMADKVRWFLPGPLQ